MANRVDIVVDVDTKRAKKGFSEVSNGFKRLAGSAAVIGAAVAGIGISFDVFKRGFNAVETFNKSITETAAVITSLQKTQEGVDIAEQYQLARTFAKGLVPILEQVAEQTAASGEQVIGVNEQLVKQGILLDTTNVKQVDGLRSLSNAFAVIVGDVDQVVTEFDALTTGIGTADDKLLKFAKIKFPNIKELIPVWKEQGVLVEKLGEAFIGFDAASQDIGGTWEAIKSTFDTTVNSTLRQGFAPIFQDILNSVKAFDKVLKNNRDKIIPGMIKGYIIVRRLIQNIGKSWEFVVQTVQSSAIVQTLDRFIDLYSRMLGVQDNLQNEILQTALNWDRQLTVQQEVDQIMKQFEVSTEGVNEAQRKLSENLAKSVSPERAKEIQKINEGWEKTQAKLQALNGASGLPKIAQNLNEVSASYQKIVNQFSSAEGFDFQLVNQAFLAEATTLVEAEVKSMNERLLNADKARLEQTQALWQENYQSIRENFNETLGDILTQTRELESLEGTLSSTRQTTRDLEFSLIQRNLSGYEKYEATQTKLEEDVKVASELTGQARVAALQKVQQQAATMTNAVVEGNITWRTEAEATEEALKRVQDIGKLIESGIQDEIKQREQSLQQVVAWSDTLQGEMAAAEEQVNSLAEQVAALDAQLAEQSEIGIDTAGARQSVDSLQSYIDQVLPDTIVKELRIDITGTGSTKRPIMDKLAEVEGGLTGLPSETGFNIGVKGAGFSGVGVPPAEDVAAGAGAGAGVVGVRAGAAVQVNFNGDLIIRGGVDANGEINYAEFSRQAASSMEEELDRLQLVR